MASDDLILRVKRLYAAIRATEENDISKFVPEVINDGRRIGFSQAWESVLGDFGVKL